MSRKAVNEIMVGRLYQRGNMLSWPRSDKVKLFKERNISIVVNLWTKMDLDMSSIPLDCYLYLPTPRSKDMIRRRILLAAEMVAKMMAADRKAATLVLCEAGVTRSVFFCVLLEHYLHNMPLPAAYMKVVGCLPKHRMKDFMRKYCGRGN